MAEKTKIERRLEQIEDETYDLSEAVECIIDQLKAIRRDQARMRDSLELLQVHLLGEIRKEIGNANHDSFLIGYASTVLNMDEALAQRVISDLGRSDQLNSLKAGHC